MNPIEKTRGPCIVLAGAGTGKTYTIVEKIKHLTFSNEYLSNKIACITFSNEAANNLFLRIKNKLNFEDDKMPVVKTFHSFSAELLRTHGEKIGISSRFKILDPDQAKVILHRSLKVQPMYCHNYISTIGTIKDLGIDISDFDKYLSKNLSAYSNLDISKRLEDLQFSLQTLDLNEDKEKKKELLLEIKKLRNLIDISKFVNVWKSYEKIKLKGDYQDYSDLNKNVLVLLEKFPEVANNFDYVIVDEFQDTNRLQLDFLMRLTLHGNITIVGDLNQSIYRFRGAYKDNIKIFKSKFNVESGDIFNLDKSYRSSNRILRVAHKLISKNYENPEDCFFVQNAHNREGNKVNVFELKNSKEEARKVLEIIQSQIDEGVPPEDICVIFRTHQFGRIIKKIFDENNISYSSVSKSSLLKQKSVKTIINYLTILNKLKKKENGGEREWWDLIYNSEFIESDLIKIGKYIKDFSKDSEKNLSIELFNKLSALDLSNSGKLYSKIIIDRLKELIPNANKKISELIKDVFFISGVLPEGKNKEEKEILLNLNLFYEKSRMYEDLYDYDLNSFLHYLDVLNNLGIDIPASELEEKGIRLMTSHSTKGLEFKKVILTNFAQKRFPLERYMGNSLIPTELLPEVKEFVYGMDDIERENFILEYEKSNQLLEERRLAYVSFTRAKEDLYITFASDYSGKKSYPSKFLLEIDYKNNLDINYILDNDEKYLEPKLEIKKAFDFSNSINSDNFDSLILQVIKQGERNIEKPKLNHKNFSPSALLLFSECQKKFEYKYIYNMPDKKNFSWEAIRLGSFVHLILERGVSAGYNNVSDFISLAKQLNLDSDWESVDLEEANLLIRVFFERNYGRYNLESKTEQYLDLNLAGMNFIGFADRIDFVDGKAVIIDYKTGKSSISPKARNWQLGFYALAAKEKYGGISKVVLDMLRQNKPLEFEIDEKGNASCISSDRISGFNIYEVEGELIKAAHQVQEAYKLGFKPCSVESNCDFCNEYVYGF